MNTDEDEGHQEKELNIKTTIFNNQKTGCTHIYDYQLQADFKSLDRGI